MLTNAMILTITKIIRSSIEKKRYHVVENSTAFHIAAPLFITFVLFTYLKLKLFSKTVNSIDLLGRRLRFIRHL